MSASRCTSGGGGDGRLVRRHGDLGEHVVVDEQGVDGERSHLGVGVGERLVGGVVHFDVDDQDVLALEEFSELRDLLEGVGIEPAGGVVDAHGFQLRG
jgi:hypothetical protein